MENWNRQENPTMKRNLLLCVDAFGTLFRPRSPIAEQYGMVARGMGVNISDDEVAKSFRSAFKETSKAYPNYGKATDLGARQWWTEKLSAQPSRPASSSPRLVVGVITNSDDRVPDVLNSLGLRVNHLRHGSKVEKEAEQEQKDIDFCIMSYDVGCEKPDDKIFDAATSLLCSILESEGSAYRKEDWELLYVGDEVKKDAQGAIDAGWNAVIVDRGGEKDMAYEGDAPGVEGFMEVGGKKVPILKNFETLGTYGGHYLLASE
ncbi:hypothetical protein D6C84_04998 [Aureobasidium pullulans]|uniref:HAD-like protein n=1 Tax=Aureobasidium pullulans TaxID=5580 RepID=A0A4S9XTL3_AURPU|nr:hypothetical protein D6C84_04998 [Aureobasidium pullulans]